MFVQKIANNFIFLKIMLTMVKNGNIMKAELNKFKQWIKYI